MSVTKQAVINGELVTFTENGRYSKHPYRKDFIGLRTILEYAAMAHGIPKFWSYDGTLTATVFRRIVATNVLNKSDYAIVSDGTGDFRFVHKTAVEKLILWLKSQDWSYATSSRLILKKTIGDASIKPEVVDHPTVDQSVEMICASIPAAEPVVAIQEQVAQPKDKEATIARLKEQIDLSVNSAVERNIEALQKDFVRVYGGLKDGFEYQRSIGLELRGQIDALKELNASLRSENEQLRKRNDKLIRENLVLTASVTPQAPVPSPAQQPAQAETPKLSIFRRWFGITA